jgi:hypothetical protein
MHMRGTGMEKEVEICATNIQGCSIKEITVAESKEMKTG